MSDRLHICAREFAQNLFNQVRELSLDEPGVSRQGYGEKESTVHEILKNIALSLDMEIKVDIAGNLFLTLPGQNRDLPAFMSGSHADSVPHGGNYDGFAGVVAAITCAWWMRQIQFVPPRDYTVVVFRMEESSWFGKAYVGSLAMTGALTEKELRLTHRDTGETLCEVIEKAGFTTKDILKGIPTIKYDDYAAFVELHIEQGPTLDANPKDGARVGVVTGIRGNLRHKICKVLGVTAHSGAVEKRFRYDAVCAFAEFVTTMERRWQQWLNQNEDLVFTVGACHTGLGSAIAIIPGEVSFTIDMRSLSMNTLARFHQLMIEVAQEIGKARQVTFTFDDVMVCEAADVSPRLMEQITQAAQRVSIPTQPIASGAGHDAAVLSNTGIPTAMIFVANQKGSHNAHEAMEIDDFMLATEVLWETIKTFQAVK